MKNKKDFPLKVLRELEIVRSNIFSMLSDKDYLTLEYDKVDSIKIKDADLNSTFFFSINSVGIYTGGEVKAQISYSPDSHSNIKLTNRQVKLLDVTSYLKFWIEKIESYNVISLESEDDRILSTYEKEFFEEFEIIDEDAHLVPFNLDQQIVLDKYLEIIEQKLLENKDQDAQVIRNEAIELRKEIPKLTKKHTIKRLSKVLAKIRKMSIPLIKEVFTEIKKQLIKSVVDGSLETIIKSIQ